jgi:hypothetical protein
MYHIEEKGNGVISHFEKITIIPIKVSFPFGENSKKNHKGLLLTDFTHRVFQIEYHGLDFMVLPYIGYMFSPFHVV